ncbi:MAG: beta-L-arabinofuranosidase domain-containing protein, partial [Fimbriimonadaceae bacterium]
MPLHNPAFRPVSVRKVEPTGWLARQLQIQIEGLSGNLDTFWPDIEDSAWIGGEAEGWERMPYWLDGVIPLAWLTGNERLQERINGYLDYILKHQHEDGWLGPRPEEKPEAEDVWSQALALKMLVEYFDATRDKRVPVAVEKNLRMMDRWIDKRPLHKWGQFRWFEFLVALFWLYERTEEEWLLQLAVKLRAQGFGWKDFFAQWPLTEATEKGRWNFAGHVVNNAMAVKESGLVWRLTGNLGDRDAAHHMIAQLDEHHGMPTGVFTGDECLAGTSPMQGTELCSVAEYMYSLEHLTAVFGEVAFADRLERIAFNALPATFSPDMWAHQYDQQVNQIECSVREERTFNTNRGDANLYGLEPHFGCCTANLSQAWPKFAKHLWMRTADGGVAAVAYAPSKLSTEVEEIGVEVETQTDYPFRDEVKLVVRTDKPVRFAFHL